MIVTLEDFKYKIWDTKTECYDEDLLLDQSGQLFECIDGWGCEGGGGAEYGGIDRKRYEIHIDLNIGTGE
jgi:hypothetical protein